MNKIIINKIASLVGLVLPILLTSQLAFAQLIPTKVEFDTTEGQFVIQLNDEKSPITVANFLRYVNDKFYDGLIFHRVINDFMIQGGGHFPDMTEKTVTYPPIKNEATNGLSNLRGTIAMARFRPPDTADAQFFINVTDNKFLDHLGIEESKYGYAVFGQVISGMDVIDKIKAVKTFSKDGYDDIPETPIIINSIQVISNKQPNGSAK
jgi:cyclophilin family peptidyl-prolyl cis-trans isomerase